MGGAWVGRSMSPSFVFRSSPTPGENWTRPSVPRPPSTPGVPARDLGRGPTAGDDSFRIKPLDRRHRRGDGGGGTVGGGTSDSVGNTFIGLTIDLREGEGRRRGPGRRPLPTRLPVCRVLARRVEEKGSKGLGPTHCWVTGGKVDRGSCRVGYGVEPLLQIPPSSPSVRENPSPGG